jgi:serine/threonine-protein kinase
VPPPTDTPVPPPTDTPVPPPTNTPVPQLATVPNVINQDQAQAIAAIQNAGLRATVNASGTNCGTPFKVVGQHPQGGVQVPPGSNVALTTCAQVIVPDVRGMALGQAQAELSNAGLAVGAVTEVISREHPAGTVLGTRPGPGASVAGGAVVNIEVFKRPDGGGGGDENGDGDQVDP